LIVIRLPGYRWSAWSFPPVIELPSRWHRGLAISCCVKTNAARPAPHAIIISYAVINVESLVTISSRTGYPTRCSVLADPKGDGGFTSAGMIDVPGAGTLVEKRWPQAMGMLNIGNFEGGPQGGAGGTSARR